MLLLFYLVRSYLLSRVDLPEVRCYWFAVPNVGRIVQWILDARVELAGIVDRAPHKEMLRAQLAARPLKKSDIHAVYHVEEMVASERLRAFDAAADGKGALLRKGYFV